MCYGVIIIKQPGEVVYVVSIHKSVFQNKPFPKINSDKSIIFTVLVLRQKNKKKNIRKKNHLCVCTLKWYLHYVTKREPYNTITTYIKLPSCSFLLIFLFFFYFFYVGNVRKNYYSTVYMSTLIYLW